MNTRNRPGMVACDVSRAPFVPSGSFATWTMISCPSFSSSSIFGSGPFSPLDDGRAVPGLHAHRRSRGRLTQDRLARRTGQAPPVSYTHLRAHETPEHLVC